MDTRRRSPGYVRQWPDKGLHAVTFRMQRQRATVGLTAKQEWLWDACISELEYRRRQARPMWRGCHCELCFDPER